MDLFLYFTELPHDQNAMALPSPKSRLPSSKVKAACRLVELLQTTKIHQKAYYTFHDNAIASPHYEELSSSYGARSLVGISERRLLCLFRKWSAVEKQGLQKFLRADVSSYEVFLENKWGKGSKEPIGSSPYSHHQDWIKKKEESIFLLSPESVQLGKHFFAQIM